jgi:microcystin-dependent protein
MSSNDKKIILLKKISPASFLIENIITNKEKTIYDLFDEFKSSITMNKIDYLPIGTIIIYSGNVFPNNWLNCDGSQLLVNDYFDLYNVISNIYGGDNYVFNLPDLKGKTLIGVNDKYYLGKIGGNEVNVLSIDELPMHNFSGKTNLSGYHNHNEFTGLNGDHTHIFNSNDYGLIHKSIGNNNTVNNLSLTNGIDLPDLLTKPLKLEINNSGEHVHSITNDGNHNHKFTTNSIGLNKYHNIMQPYITMNYLIKYK